MVPLWASRRELLCVKAPPRLVKSISNCLYLEIIQLLVRFLSWLINISGSLLALSGPQETMGQVQLLCRVSPRGSKSLL